MERSRHAGSDGTPPVAAPEAPTEGLTHGGGGSGGAWYMRHSRYDFFAAAGPPTAEQRLAEMRRMKEGRDADAVIVPASDDAVCATGGLFDDGEEDF